MTSSHADRVAARAGCVVVHTTGPMSFAAFLQHYASRGVWLLWIGNHVTTYRHGITPVHSKQERLLVRAAYRIEPQQKGTLCRSS